MQRSIPFFVALIAFLLGTIAPALLLGITGRAIVNPVWQSVFGSAFLFWSNIFGIPKIGAIGLIYVLICSVVWPIILVIMIVFAGKWVLTQNRSTKINIYALLFGTFLVNIETLPKSNSQITQLPLFIGYIQSLG